MKTQLPNRKLLVVPLLLALGLNANAQLLNETFETDAGFTITDGAGANDFFSDGSNDYFGIYDGDGDLDADFGTTTTNPTGLPAYSSIDGNYIAGEDIDATEGGTLPYTLTWSGIALSGETSLAISADFASTRIDADDSIILAYRLDGGAWVEILGIAGAAGTFNSPPFEITDFSADTGNAAATPITAAFTNIGNTFALAGTETTLDIRAEFRTNNSSDNFGMDNLVVQVPVADVTPPTLSSTFPGNTDTDILPVTNLQLTFDENVQLGTGTIVIKELVGDAIFESFDVATSPRVTASDATVTIDPTSDLAPTTGYYVEVASGAVEDTSGNDFLGFSGSGTLSFTTSAPVATGIFINEVDADTPGTDAAEFIELYDGGAGNTSLSGLVVVLFNGGGDVSYDAIDLDGQTTDGDGFFVIGSATVPNVDLVEWTTNGLQNGADAVALYVGNDTDFPNNTAVTNVNLLDAVVYDTNDGDDSGLISVLTPGQPQRNEGDNGNQANESNSRVPDGGTQLQTVTYAAQTPTPGATNGGSSDTTPPSIVTRVPADDSPAVLTIENLQLFFDEDIQAGTGNIEIYEVGNGTPVQTIDVTTALIIGGGIQIDPSNLTAGTDHYVLIDNGAIEDTLGNAFTGITDITAWSFTTASGTLGTDEAIRTGTVEPVGDGGGAASDDFYAQSTSGGNFNEYSLAEFDMSFENFSGNSVTDIINAKLILTNDDPFFAASGDFVILFTTDSVGDLSTSSDYDQLVFEALSTNGIDTSSYTDTPVSVGTGSFSDATGGGFTDVVEITLATIEADLITAINNRDSFHFILGSVDADTGAVTYSGVGNTNNPGAPTLALTVTTGAAVAAINITESSGSTDVDETGPSSDTFDVVLNSAPAGDVTVNLTPDAQVTTTVPSLLFTTGDWFTPQTVTVTAVDDPALEDIVHSGSVSLTTSGDVSYSGVTTSVSVNVTDNDFGATDAVINEFVADHDNAIGSDTQEFIEILGSPNTDYSSLYILEIEGDSSSNEGQIDEVVQLGTTDANGFLVYNFNNGIENGTITLLLVQGFTGSAGDDIDANDDGTIDNAPWASIIDGVASFEGGTDIAYVDDPAVVSLNDDFDGGSNQVGGASRIPDGTDNDLITDWVRNDFNGFGLTGGPAAGTDSQAENTPGTANTVFFDTTAPTISTLSPADNASDFLLDTNLEADFDEDIQPGTGVITLRLASDDSIVESFDVTTEDTNPAINIFNNTVQLNPTADLEAGVAYYVLIPAGAVTDTAATPNAFAGILAKTEWRFRQLTTLSSEDFNDTAGDADDWFNATVTGVDVWNVDSPSGEIDGYAGLVDNGAEEHYLVSPALNLSSETEVSIIFDYEGAYDDGDPDSMELVYSTDYSGSGNPEATATWTEIPFDFSPNLQAGDPTATLVSSGTVALPLALEGEPVVYLAFRYNAGGGELDSEAWEIDNILVTSVTSPNPLATYLTARGIDTGLVETDTNGNGFTVLEEYLASFGDGSGTDTIVYGVDPSADAFTLISDSAAIPAGITVELMATSDLSVAMTSVAYTVNSVDNGDGTFTLEFVETGAPSDPERFYALSITSN